MTDYSVKRFNQYSDDELLDTAKQLAEESGSVFLSGRTYQKETGISPTTIENRFGSWAAFCEKADLKPRITFDNAAETLFKNLDEVWEKLGRQPRAKEMKQPLSAISYARYQRKFGDWYKACLEFLAWKSGASVEEIEQEAKTPLLQRAREHKTARSISLSLRYEVLRRDNFKCVRCGQTPASNPGVELHIDHKQPYSKGGETVLENLQVLCSECNLGKSNRHEE